MLSNYFTFFHCAQLLQKRYTESVIADAYTQEKNKLNILLYTPEPHTLTISCEARKNFIVAQSGEHRARHNSVDLFPSLVNKTLAASYISSSDRVVYIQLSDGSYLLCEMFGAKANVLLCNQEGTVVDAFLSKKVTTTTPQILQQKAQSVSVENFLSEKNSFISILRSSNEQSLYNALKKTFPKLGSTLVTEILHRSHLATDVQQQNLSVIEYTALYANAYDLILEMLQPTNNLHPVIYFDNQTPVLLSLVPLQHCLSYRNETCNDIFSAIQKFLSYEKFSLAFEQEKRTIELWLRKELAKIERTIAALESERAESSRAERYELNAKLILANLHAIRKGMKSVEVENLFSANEPVSIPLDPSLTPAQNAERYFEKEKKTKMKMEEAMERLALFRRRHETLQKLQEQYTTAFKAAYTNLQTGISIKNFLNSIKKELRHFGFMTEQDEKELPPFKIFTVDGGFTVYAGKNSENNDLLTLKYAKPNDLWFHARGSSGSHVVLKAGSAPGPPSKKAIEQAAAIAAYYSKMKNAKTVPIAITEKKYVRKPKGASAGTVVIEREKVIFVEPGLPEQGK